MESNLCDEYSHFECLFPSSSTAKCCHSRENEFIFGYRLSVHVQSSCEKLSGQSHSTVSLIFSEKTSNKLTYAFISYWPRGRTELVLTLRMALFCLRAREESLLVFF